jgi:hypothetical protein
MSSQLNTYRQLEFAWTLARADAGGKLTTAEEVMWTEAIGNVWRQLTEEEREAVEADPTTTPGVELFDRDLQLGESGQERSAA